MLSAEDFGHYLIAQLNDGVYREATILSPAGIAALHRPEVAITNTAGSYALGWEVQRYQDVSVVSHNGAVPGFTTGMFLVPEKRLAVAVMLNTYSPMLGTRIEAVPGNVLRLLLGQAIVERHEFVEMQLAYVVLMGIPWLEGVAIVESLRRIRRWHAGPRRPSRARVLSFMLGTLSWTILLAAVLLIVLPNTFDADLPSMVLFQPDVGWAVMLGAAIALLWAAISVWVGLAAWHRTA